MDANDQNRLTDSEMRAGEGFMAIALAEAKKAEGRTHPNPCVGVVIVKAGRIVGKGFHAKAGGPHAEVVALRQAGDEARGADVYSTLEPCNHTGRTPPCTEALIRAGVARVFVGCTDVNPKVSGKGIARLREAGIQVFTGILEKECREENSPFFTLVTTHRPFVTLKVASTCDGKIATQSGHSQWITCPESLAMVHRLRDACDAVLVGAGTIRADDSLLTARPEGVAAERQPIRAILASHLSALPPRARIFASATPEAPVLIFTCAEEDERTSWLHGFEESFTAGAKANSPAGNAGIQLIAVPRDDRGMVSLPHVLDELGRRDVMHLMVEGGAQVFGAFVEEKLFHEVRLFIAPRIIGPGISWASLSPRLRMDQATNLALKSSQQVGQDLMLTLIPSDIPAP